MTQRIVDQTIKPEDLEKLEKKAQKAKETKAKNKDKVQKTKKKRSANYVASKKILDNSKVYSTKEAVKLIRKALHAKFTETLECHVNLGIDTKNSDQRVRFTTSLPNGIGKSVKVLVISASDKGKDGNVLWRDVKSIDEIVFGKLKPEIDFNVIIAAPAMMKELGKAARFLGPKGLMPSPKTGTITDKPEKVIEDLAKGQVEIKSQPSHAVLHQIVGNFSFTDEQLIENVDHLLTELQKNSPSKMKKKLVQRVFLTSSMGPSIRVAL
ncbi:50S ribosomal protein L1 [candidate division WWE3 bacterium CG_4_9_14_0_2_um_filter_35_11]|uniref:Large ribosomal subunit protein uL1 n=1 Tax=candidate division WWE3 bacterium CG_4_9_14_0_2_um_filter_35_11 TaxID=1975077 RepID=A0A2M8EM38_UNCKA|nr:MAG: 50S ribosomal protein L1 [candidate division WWE3 bacterium CG10_big_fil_rev_8_21_14_0_10_35_32]PJC23802.1 MAG: 50S ribosomal protein L1 [candidate division WWE3 bacterium CG_4_9_14_0_2_um_filter_35_11]